MKRVIVKIEFSTSQKGFLAQISLLVESCFLAEKNVVLKR